MTVPERVVDLIRKSKPRAWCDNCIHAKLGLARHQQAQQATSAIGATSEFVRERGTCDDCGEERTVTRVGG